MARESGRDRGCGPTLQRVRGDVIAGWVKAICRALDAAGCDSAALLAEAGFNPECLDGPGARCPLANTARLWELSVAATGDPAFGIKVASHIKNTTFHALSYGLSASSTLREAFERLQRYCHVGSCVVEYDFFRCGSEYHCVIDTTAAVPLESIDALVSAQLRMCRSLLGRDHSPLLIELQRPRPARIDDFERLLRAPLRFKAARNRLIFDSTSIERPLDGGSPELARHSDAIALQYLARIDRDDIPARVREVLVQRLEKGEPSQEEVAEQLNLSARTLQRRLGESGVTYKQLLDGTRRGLAMAYLRTPQHSVSDVTYLLGFSCDSSFTRAFRRWTGQSPSDWRAAAGSGVIRRRGSNTVAVPDSEMELHISR
jgi:AraC-like DNA-binding protein